MLKMLKKRLKTRCDGGARRKKFRGVLGSKKKLSFVVFANFHNVNTPTMADIKLPEYY